MELFTAIFYNIGNNMISFLTTFATLFALTSILLFSIGMIRH